MNIKKEIEKRELEITTLQAIDYCQRRIIRHEADIAKFKMLWNTWTIDHYKIRIEINQAIISRLLKRFEK